MAMPAKRAKYVAKNSETKVEILKTLDEGISREEVMRQYDVKRSILGTYAKNKVQILEAFKNEKFHAARKRMRTAAHPQLEDALLPWIGAARDAWLPRVPRDGLRALRKDMAWYARPWAEREVRWMKSHHGLAECPTSGTHCSLQPKRCFQHRRDSSNF